MHLWKICIATHAPHSLYIVLNLYRTETLRLYFHARKKNAFFNDNVITGGETKSRS